MRDAYQSTDYSHHVTKLQFFSARRVTAMISDDTLAVFGVVVLVVLVVILAVLFTARHRQRKLKRTIPTRHGWHLQPVRTWHGGQLIVAWALAGVGYLSVALWGEYLRAEEVVRLARSRASYIRRCEDGGFGESLAECGRRWDGLSRSTPIGGFEDAVAPIGLALAFVMLVITWRWFGFQATGRTLSQAELRGEPLASQPETPPPTAESPQPPAEPEAVMPGQSQVEGSQSQLADPDAPLTLESDPSNSATDATIERGGRSMES